MTLDKFKCLSHGEPHPFGSFCNVPTEFFFNFEGWIKKKTDDFSYNENFHTLEWKMINHCKLFKMTNKNKDICAVVWTVLSTHTSWFRFFKPVAHWWLHSAAAEVTDFWMKNFRLSCFPPVVSLGWTDI